MHNASEDTRRVLVELAAVIGRLGLTAFGGSAADIALMHRDVVEERAWLTDGDVHSQPFHHLLRGVQVLDGGGEHLGAF